MIRSFTLGIAAVLLAAAPAMADLVAGQISMVFVTSLSAEALLRLLIMWHQFPTNIYNIIFWGQIY